jgi:hypothetical protein
MSADNSEDKVLSKTQLCTQIDLSTHTQVSENILGREKKREEINQTHRIV